MAAAIPFIMLAGTAVGAAGQIQQGQQQKQMAAEEARQMQSQAKNEYATSQIQAMEDRRLVQMLHLPRLSVTSVIWKVRESLTR